MLIEVMSSLFDEIGLDSTQRRNAARALVRTMCKITTYRQEVDAYLREAIGSDNINKEKERKVFKWWQSNRCNRELIVMFWRGVHCLVHTQNAEYAEFISGIQQRDLRYAMSHLTQKDIAAIKASKLSWRRPAISQKHITKLMTSVASSINHYAYKLKFITGCEVSLTHEDVVSMLRLEALALIAHYECERDKLHIKNTVLRGLKSAWSEMSSYYKREKRDCMPSHVREDENGKHFEYESIRQGLTVKSSTEEGDSESENPALLARSITIDKEIEVRSLVALIRRKVPRYGKYLSLCVFTDEKHSKFHKWLKRNNKKPAKSQAAYMQQARRYCEVTAHDEARAKKLVTKELGVLLGV